MPETVTTFWLAVPGVGWIALAALVAGVVRGFSGFGTAMIFLPVAALFLDPVAALICITFMDMFGPLPVIPQAWRDVDRRALARLLSGAFVMLPLGLWLLLSVEPEVFRYAVSGVSLTMLACLLLGLRYTGRLSGPATVAVGGAGGFLGGVAGIPGPPVILAYMAGDQPPRAIRAITMLYLYVFEFALIVVIALYGLLTLPAVLLGLGMAIPNAVGSVIGGAMFRPGQERVYRGVAYAIIAFSAIYGLPIWD